MPDAHMNTLPTLPDGPNPGQWMLFWPSSESSRTIAHSPFPEVQVKSRPDPEGGVCRCCDDYDQGGRWLNQVCRLDRNTLIGFFHAEVRPLFIHMHVHSAICRVL